MTVHNLVIGSTFDSIGELYPTLSIDPACGVNYYGYADAYSQQVPNPGTPPPDLVPNFYLGLRFALPVGQGKTIVSATLRVFIRDGATGDRPWHTIQAQADDDAAAFVTDYLLGPGSYDLSSRSLGSELVTWGDGSDLGLSNHDPVDIDVTSLVQEIVDRPGWTSGNHMVLVIKPVDTQAFNVLSIALGGDGYPAHLDVVDSEHYGATVMGAGAAIGIVPTLDKAALASLGSEASLVARATVIAIGGLLEAASTLLASGTIERLGIATAASISLLGASAQVRSAFVLAMAVLATAPETIPHGTSEWAAMSALDCVPELILGATHRSSSADFAGAASSARPALAPPVAAASPAIRPRPGSARMEW